MNDFDTRLSGIVDRALWRKTPRHDDLSWLLAATDSDTMAIVSAVSKIRFRNFSNRVKLNFLLNIKSGLCPEDCRYCSQARGSTAAIPTYPVVDRATFMSAAQRARELGASRLCLVASGHGPTDRELDQVTSAIETIKASDPDLEICACLGILKRGQGERLRQAGVFAYNHNLNTSEGFYGEVCSTHSFGDRKVTAQDAQSAGLSLCSGVLVGMGETNGDILAAGYALRELGPESVPVNFLIPIEGTPLANRRELTPLRCLRILAAYRCLFPEVELRIAGGREVHLRSLQALGLYLANSIFIGDYLTTKGQAALADQEMIADAGLVIEGATLPAVPSLRVAEVRLKQSAFD